MATNYQAVASNRYRNAVTTQKGYFVVHDSESGDDSYQSLLNFVRIPGVIPVSGSNPVRYYGSCYNALTNGEGKNSPSKGYTELLGMDAAPNAAPPLNDYGAHICIPGRAGQTRDEWLDPTSLKHIEGVASYILDKYKQLNIPLRRVDVPFMISSGITAPAVGICGHVDVSNAWHKTTHTDPGSHFPWDILMAMLQIPVTPTDPIALTNTDLDGGHMKRMIIKWDAASSAIAHTDLMTYWCYFDNGDQYYTSVMHPDFFQDRRGPNEDNPDYLGVPFLLNKLNWPKLYPLQVSNGDPKLK